MDAKLKTVGSFILVAAMLTALFMLGEEPATLAKDRLNIQENCSSASNKEQCYGKAFALLTEKTDMRHAFEVLRALQQNDPAARGCHFIAHSITTAETEKNPARWKEVMNAAPQDCSYGGVHGALEHYASSFPGGKLPKSEIGNLCDNPDTNNCSHGLGHVLLVMNDNNIDESAQDCEALPHDDRAKFECLTGVFMERSTAANLYAHGFVGQEALNWIFRLPETEALCREQSGLRAVACWKETVHVGLVAFRNNPQKIIDFCQSAPGERETRECIDHSLGVIAGSRDFELAQLKSVCDAQAEAPDFKERCYPQLVASVLSTVPRELPAAKSFCASLENQYQPACFKMVKNFETRNPPPVQLGD